MSALDDANAHLLKAQAAYDKALEAQQYTITGAAGGGRATVRADLTALGNEVQRWKTEVARLTRNASGGGIRIGRGVPS